MKILFAIHQFYPEFSGGTERVALNLARAAQRAGHHVHVMSAAVAPNACGGSSSAELEGAFDAVYQGVPVTFVPRSLLPSAAAYSFETDPGLVERLVVWLKNEKFDLVHVMHPMRMGSVLLAVQRCGVPYLLTLTDFFSVCFLINLINMSNQICPGSGRGARCADECLVAPWTNESLARRYQQANGVLAAASVRVCPSEYVAKRYREEFPGQEFKVIPHGIDLLALQSEDVPAKHNAVGGGLTFGFVGSIVPQKGLDILLRAFSLVQDPSLRLLVVGGMHGDAYHSDVVRRLAQADKRVELLGPLPPGQAFGVIRELDVLCLPSAVPETFSLVLHEAAAVGVPALVSTLGAPGVHVSKHGGGQSLPPNDVQAWSAAIANVAENPQVLEGWRRELVLPLRVEEEAFFYESLYRQLCRSHTEQG